LTKFNTGHSEAKGKNYKYKFGVTVAILTPFDTGFA
jgi:hypothetical protein